SSGLAARYTTRPMARISRRGFLHGSANLAWGVVGLQLLSACTPAAPSAPTTSSASTGGRVKLPTSVPMANLPKPDLPGTPDGLVVPGYLRYPSSLVKSVPQPPGKG